MTRPDELRVSIGAAKSMVGRAAVDRFGTGQTPRGTYLRAVLLRREIENLKRDILALCAVVEESVSKAMTAVGKRDAALAREVIEGDPQIDQLEVDLEEECLKILALHQPVAADLRFIIAVLKINNDLERIGDLATNIAKRSLFLADHSVREPETLPRMAEKVREMLRQSLDAFVDFDADRARTVLQVDDEVDNMHKEMFRGLQEATRAEPDHVEGYTQYLTISRNLERIADLATNICEDVIYLIEGKIVRHHHEI